MGWKDEIDEICRSAAAMAGLSAPSDEQVEAELWDIVERQQLYCSDELARYRREIEWCIAAIARRYPALAQRLAVDVEAMRHRGHELEGAACVALEWRGARIRLTCIESSDEPIAVALAVEHQSGELVTFGVDRCASMPWYVAMGQAVVHVAGHVAGEDR